MSLSEWNSMSSTVHARACRGANASLGLAPGNSNIVAIDVCASGLQLWSPMMRSEVGLYYANFDRRQRPRDRYGLNKKAAWRWQRRGGRLAPLSRSNLRSPYP